VLGRDAQTIGIKDILDCVRNSGKNFKTRSDGSREEDEVNRLIVKLDQSMAKVLEGKNLQELILSLAAPQDRR
jgi:DNA-binding IscR family transcriptional regulator